jgi:hypothetical protein
MTVHRLSILMLGTLLSFAACDAKPEEKAEAKQETKTDAKTDAKADAKTAVVEAPETGLGVVVTRTGDGTSFSGDYDGTGMLITSYDKRTVWLASKCPLLTCEKASKDGQVKMGYSDDPEIQQKCADGLKLTMHLGKENDPLPKVGKVEATLDTSKIVGISALGWLNPATVDITKSSDTSITGTIDYKDENGDMVKGKFTATVCK